MTTYVELHKSVVKAQREAYKKQFASGLPGLLDKMLRQADEYDDEYLHYAREADAFNEETDNIELRLRSFTLHKRQDAFDKTEFYYAAVVGDNGKHKANPKVELLEQYRQMRKDETWTFRDPQRIYQGNPKGEIQYKILCFDTQRTNHDNTVQAAQAILGAVATAVAAIVAGPAVLAVSTGVTAVSGAITKAAVRHKDEMFDIFPGTLTLNDPVPADRGPYSLARPYIKLKTERITVMLQVARNPNVRDSATTPTRRGSRTARVVRPA